MGADCKARVNRAPDHGMPTARFFVIILGTSVDAEYLMTEEVTTCLN